MSGVHFGRVSYGGRDPTDSPTAAGPHVHLSMSQKISELTREICVLNAKVDDCERHGQISAADHEIEVELILRNSSWQVSQAKLLVEEQVRDALRAYESLGNNLRDQVDRYKVELTSRERETTAQWTQKIIDLRIELEMVNKQCMQQAVMFKVAVEKREREVENLRAKHADELEGLHTLAAEEAALAEEKHKRLMSEADDKYAQSLGEATQKHQMLLDEVHQRIENVRQEENQRLEDALQEEERRQAQLERRLVEARTCVAELRERYEGTVSNLNTRTEELHKMREESAKRERHLTQELEELTNRLAEKETLSEKLQTQLVELETTSQQQKEAIEEHEAARRRLDSELERLTQQGNQLAEELHMEQAKHEQLKQDFEIADAAATAQIQELEAGAEEFQRQLDETGTELRQVKKQAESDRLLTQQKHTQEKNTLIDDHEATRKALIDEFEATRKAIIGEHAATRKALEDEHEATTKALVTDHAAIKGTLEGEVKRLEERNLEITNKIKYLETAERAVATKLQMLADENKELVERSQAQREMFTAQRDRSEEEQANLKKTFDLERKTLIEKHRLTQINLETQIRDLTTKEAKLLERERAFEAASAAAAADIQRLSKQVRELDIACSREQAQKKELSNVILQAQAKEVELNLQRSELIDKIEEAHSIRSRLENDMKVAGEASSLALSLAETRAEDERVSMQEELETCQKQHDDNCKTLSMKHAFERERMVSEHAMGVRELTDRLQDLETSKVRLEEALKVADDVSSVQLRELTLELSDKESELATTLQRSKVDRAALLQACDSKQQASDERHQELISAHEEECERLVRDLTTSKGELLARLQEMEAAKTRVEKELLFADEAATEQIQTLQKDLHRKEEELVRSSRRTEAERAAWQKACEDKAKQLITDHEIERKKLRNEICRGKSELIAKLQVFDNEKVALAKKADDERADLLKRCEVADRDLRCIQTVCSTNEDTTARVVGELNQEVQNLRSEVDIARETANIASKRCSVLVAELNQAQESADSTDRRNQDLCSGEKKLERILENKNSELQEALKLVEVQRVEALKRLEAERSEALKDKSEERKRLVSGHEAAREQLAAQVQRLTNREKELEAKCIDLESTRKKILLDLRVSEEAATNKIKSLSNSVSELRVELASKNAEMDGMCQRAAAEREALDLKIKQMEITQMQPSLQTAAKEIELPKKQLNSDGWQPESSTKISYLTDLVDELRKTLEAKERRLSEAIDSTSNSSQRLRGESATTAVSLAIEAQVRKIADQMSDVGSIRSQLSDMGSPPFEEEVQRQSRSREEAVGKVRPGMKIVSPGSNRRGSQAQAGTRKTQTGRGTSPRTEQSPPVAVISTSGRARGDSAINAKAEVSSRRSSANGKSPSTQRRAAVGDRASKPAVQAKSANGDRTLL